MSARAELILGLRGNLVDGLRQAQQQFQRTSQVGSRSMAVLSRSTQAAGRGIDAIGNRYLALAGGAAVIGAGRFVATQERRLTRLGIAANLSADQVAQLNASIYETAQAPDIRADPSEILAAIEAIVEKTGDLGFARDNLRNIAAGIQATGAGGQAIGELVAEMQKLGEVDARNVLKLLDTLNVQGKTGAFTLQNLAALGPRVITAYAGSVKGMRSNAEVMREMGAALQVIRQGTGSSEQAATAFERLLSDLQDAQKQKLFRRLGVQIFEFGKDGTKALRPINQLMLEFLAKTGGDRTKLGAMFGDESIRAFNAIKPENMRAFMEAQGDGTQTMRDSARAANDAAGAMQNLASGWKQFADTNLTPFIQDLADGLNSIGPGTVQSWMKTAAQIAVVVGGVIALRKVFKIASWGASLLGGGVAAKTAGGIAGGALGGAMGGFPVPLPVYVVNGKWNPIGGIPGTDAGAAAGAATKASKLATLAKGAAGVTIAGAAGVAIGTGIRNTWLEGTAVDNAIGAGIARAMALFGNETAQRAIEGARADRGAAQPVQAQEPFNGVLKIEIDNKGQARVKEARVSQPSFALDIYSGLSLVTP